MKYFVVADIHGFYDEFIKAITLAGFDEENTNHMLITLGDNFDRGRQPYEVYMYLKKLKNKGRCILVKGNHEDLMIDAIDRGYTMYHDVTNGTVKSMVDLVHKINPNMESTVDDIIECLRKSPIYNFMKDMIDYFETEGFIFVHGFIPVMKHYNYKMYLNDWRYYKDSFKMARWENGMENVIKYNIKEPGKTIVCGHFHASYGNVRKKYPNQSDAMYRYLEFEEDELFRTYYGDGIIGLDACTVRTGFVNCLVIEDNEL